MKKKIDFFAKIILVFSILLFFSLPDSTWAIFLITAPGKGGGPQLRSFDTEGNSLSPGFFAYDQDFRGGINIASGDVDGDGYEEIITGPGQGGGPQVRVFDKDGNVETSFFAYAENFRGGIDVAADDVDGDGTEEIITGAGQGGGPQVRVFDKNGNSKITPGFFAFEENFKGGVRVAAGDIDKDGKAEIIVGAGHGGGSHIRVFEANGQVKPIQFFAFHPDYRGGIDVAAADTNGDGKAEIGVCQTSEQAWCKVYRYNSQKTILGEWKAYGDFEVGAYIEMGDIDYDGKAEILIGAGQGGGSHVKVFEANGNDTSINFFSYHRNFRGGTKVIPFIDILRKKDFQKGFNFPGYSGTVFLDPTSDQSLEDLVDIGANWIALVPVWYQDTKNSTRIYQPKYDSATDKSVEHAIKKAKSLGLSVMLKPFVDSYDGTWRAEFEPASWNDWFSSYKNFIIHYARIAERLGVEQLSIGVEYNSSERYTEEWRKIISEVKKFYSGSLTYSANFSAVEGYGGGYRAIEFWDKLDYVGIDAYFPLTNKNNPTIFELNEAWQGSIKQIENWRKVSNIKKPIIFTEIGYGSYDGANKTPWAYDWSGKTKDWQEQADLYEAFFQKVYPRSWLSGVFFWYWDNKSTDGFKDDPESFYDLSFTPRGKPAEEILAKYFWQL